MILTVTGRDGSVQVAYLEDAKAVRIRPEDPKPWTVINTILYRSTFEWDEGREIYRPDWATVKSYDCDAV